MAGCLPVARHRWLLLFSWYNNLMSVLLFLSRYFFICTTWYICFHFLITVFLLVFSFPLYTHKYEPMGTIRSNIWCVWKTYLKIVPAKWVLGLHNVILPMTRRESTFWYWITWKIVVYFEMRQGLDPTFFFLVECWTYHLIFPSFEQDIKTLLVSWRSKNPPTD